jgi:peptidoglycan/xylan/chitin deacetylase (PgdA/CDA1 family)
MYHSISKTGITGSYYYGTVTSPETFERHIDTLLTAGWSIVHLHDLARALGAHGASLPNNAVAITFDDGFRDFYTDAFPVIRRFQIPVTMFLPTAFIGHSTRRSLLGRHCLTWPEVGELHRAGVTFGSHSVSHPQLADLAFTELVAEVRDSKATLEDVLGTPIESFAYPYAFPEHRPPFCRALRRALLHAGYSHGVTTIIGTPSIGVDPYFLPRLPLNEHDDVRFLLAKLTGAYNWLHFFQYLHKTLRHRRLRGRRFHTVRHQHRPVRA